LPNSLIGIDIQGIATIQNRLSKLPKEAKDMGAESANEYIVHAMQVEPPKPTQPFVWSSERQRKYVMAHMRENGYAGRTHRLKNAWTTVGEGYQQMVVNETPYAEFVQGDNQIVGHLLNDWNTIKMILKRNGAEILKKFDAGVKRALKKLKLN
jgi:hypothetical protein